MIHEGLWRVGFVLLIFVGVWAIYYISFLRVGSAYSNALLLICSLFFAPMFLTEGINGMFLSYAIAHACQYFIFMCLAVVNDPVRTAVRSKLSGLALLFGIAFGVGWLASVLQSLNQSNPASGFSIVNFGNGAILGLTLAHFVVDAGIWKLSERSAREFVTKRFRFVFSG